MHFTRHSAFFRPEEDFIRIKLSLGLFAFYQSVSLLFKSKIRTEYIRRDALIVPDGDIHDRDFIKKHKMATHVIVGECH